MKNMPSIETQHEMVRFLMKNVIPRMVEKQRELLLKKSQNGKSDT